MKGKKNKVINLKDLPNPKLHQRVSFVKSGVRILSCALGFVGFFEVGFLGMLLAEVIGVYEELV